LAVLSFLSAVELLDPKVVLLENFPSIAKRYVQFIMRVFIDLGYQCRVCTIQGAAFGVPQSRTRFSNSISY